MAQNKFLVWVCAAGHIAKEVQMGVSTSGDVLAKWRCQGCDKEIMGKTTVAKMLEIDANFEKTEPQEERIKHSKDFTPEDLPFLYGIKISTLPPE